MAGIGGGWPAFSRRRRSISARKRSSSTLPRGFVDRSSDLDSASSRPFKMALTITTITKMTGATHSRFRIVRSPENQPVTGRSLRSGLALAAIALRISVSEFRFFML